MKKFFLLVFLISCHFFAQSQGKIVLVGGGSEDYTSWSDIPYQWIVEHAANKKVAVISYSDATEWIPDYLVSLGAQAAKNITIGSRELADQQSTYDELMQYDAFFFKGGDQANYYTFYKDTKTAQAVLDKYNEGGVIAGTSAGMAILSGVIFTAEDGSVYPNETLGDYHDKDIALEDDLFPFLPGIIADSHFTERGRIGRLLPFLANWYDRTGVLLTGIGVDDRTALCVDENQIGTIYGSGSVSFYQPVSLASNQDTGPVADSIHIMQLLHGHTIDLKTMMIGEGPENILLPQPQQENGNYQVWLSGSDGVSANASFLHAFIHDTGNENDTVIVVTRPGGSQEYILALESMNVPVIVLETTTQNNSSDAIQLRNQLRRSVRILFSDNQDQSLFNFISGGMTGELLTEHVGRNNMIIGFIGSSARYAGKTYVTNYLSDPYDAYYGDLTYRQGLGLLKSSFIMPNAFDENSTDFYENTTASAMYAMIQDSVKYGIYLNGESFLRFYQENDENFYSSEGKISTLILSNPGTTVERASQPVNSSGDSRNYVGFAAFGGQLLNGTSLQVGTPMPTNDALYDFEKIVTSVKEQVCQILQVYPNPASDYVTVHPPQKFMSAELKVLSLTGEVVRKEKLEYFSRIDIAGLPAGLYILSVQNRGSGDSVQQLLIKK